MSREPRRDRARAWSLVEAGIILVFLLAWILGYIVFFTSIGR